MKLQKILEAYYHPRDLMGAEPVKDQLLGHLSSNRRLYGRLYGFYFGVVLVVFGAAFWAMIADVCRGTGTRGAILVGAGVTIAGLLKLLQGTVREWSQTDLLLRLLTKADETQIQRVIETLLSNTFGAARVGLVDIATHSDRSA